MYKNKTTENITLGNSNTNFFFCKTATYFAAMQFVQPKYDLQTQKYDRTEKKGSTHDLKYIFFNEQNY